jgi:hypothetical protein
VKGLNRSSISVDELKKVFSRNRFIDFAKDCGMQIPASRSRNSTSANSCQAVLHGCLPAENAAIHFAALQHTPETNPLREAVFPRRRNPFCFQKN